MLSRVDLFAAETLEEAQSIANRISDQMEVYSDGDSLISRHCLIEMIPDKSWNKFIPDNTHGKKYRERVAGNLIVTWKFRKEEQIAIEVAEEAEKQIELKIKAAGLGSSSIAKSVWKNIKTRGFN